MDEMDKLKAQLKAVHTLGLAVGNATIDNHRKAVNAWCDSVKALSDTVKRLEEAGIVDPMRLAALRAHCNALFAANVKALDACIAYELALRDMSPGPKN